MREFLAVDGVEGDLPRPTSCPQTPTSGPGTVLALSSRPSARPSWTRSTTGNTARPAANRWPCWPKSTSAPPDPEDRAHGRVRTGRHGPGEHPDGHLRERPVLRARAPARDPGVRPRPWHRARRTNHHRPPRPVRPGRSRTTRQGRARQPCHH